MADQPLSFSEILERNSYRRAFLDLKGIDKTNLRGEFADAFVQAFNEQFPGEQYQAARIPADDTETSFCVMLPTWQAKHVDHAKLRARIKQIIEG